MRPQLSNRKIISFSDVWLIMQRGNDSLKHFLEVDFDQLFFKRFFKTQGETIGLTNV